MSHWRPSLQDSCSSTESHRTQQLDNHLLGRRPKSVLDLLHPDTATQVHKSQTRQKLNHDRHVRERAFTVGNRVYVHDFSRKQSSKWLSGTITQLLGPRSFKVELSNGKLVRRHVDHIRVCHPTQDAPEQTEDDGILVGPGFKLIESQLELQQTRPLQRRDLQLQLHLHLLCAARQESVDLQIGSAELFFSLKEGGM